MEVPAPAAQASPDRFLLRRVAVLIVNHNTGAVLERCLRTLQPGLGLGLEVVVVDNASRDGSADMARRDFAGVSVVEADANLGFGRGENLAASHTQRDFLLILNPDCFIEPDSIARLAASLDGSPELGFVGPRIDLESGRPDHACLRNDPDPVGALLYFSRSCRGCSGALA
jgi:GT2 family glycosyltransferase